MYTLIVGAASEIALEYLKRHRDKKFILVDLEEKFTTIQNYISERDLNGCIYSIDVQNVESIELFFRKLKDERVLIKELIYCTGINHMADFINTTEDIWDKVINTNLKGCFFVMKDVAKNMIANDIQGSMVNIASQHGIVGNVNRSAYCSSKAGLINLNKVLALEFAQWGIRVNGISPTFILYEANKDYLLSQQSKRDYLRKIPLHKYCDAADIVNAIDFLLCEENKMITGHNLVIDGGWTIQ
ncbi:MAG: SDR family NAD(P)-dependent oxidoreductase [Syntrophaceticus sp.]|nr:SDR family NAD(P)-dependent oxidoreductase [Syntrophaceticus sp.]MDD3313998.1 SDR family NAD(P)-dependent oxidoreductase [Syntrophaceticus sp.]MDD4359307.1 SDR family NAD(P)-dependent oxidoreductase [Syntrophaceticus sp.]MDD4782290.1 SDR family NAD(P)-dependent oxidoreductase [Syntrophaceticus sp.]